MNKNKPWIQQYPDGVPECVDVDQYRSIPDLVSQAAKRFSDKTAFINMKVGISYAELDEYSDHFAAYLQNLSLNKGDRVAIMMPNLIQYPIVLFGILKAGLVVVNVNPLYTATELHRLLNDSGACAVVVLNRFANTLAKAMQGTMVKKIIVTQVGDCFPFFKRHLVNFLVKYVKQLVPNYSINDVCEFTKAIEMGREFTYSPVDIKSDDLAFLQYTGGTTGKAKGAMLTHKNMIANIMQSLAWVGPVIREENTLVLGALPMYHIFSLTVCCLTFLAAGTTCLLITDPRNVNQFIKTLCQYPVSVFIGLNTLFDALLHHPRFSNIKLSSLKLTVSGGMAMTSSIATRWHEQTGVPIIQGYGLTETSPIVSINPVNLKAFNASVGLPVPSTDIKIIDDAGHALALESVGEICVKGPQVMKGYWADTESSNAVLDKEGWLKTGDVGYVSQDGYLNIVDRLKDVIIVSGFNVYPNEVEEVLSSHPGVREVAVIGVPHPQKGEVVQACVVKEDKGLTEGELLKYARQSLTAYKIPKEIVFMESLPKSQVGKVLRRQLRDNA